MPCPLYIVVPAGLLVTAPLQTDGGERDLARGSVVRPSDTICSRGVAVEVLASPPWYGGDRDARAGCIDPTALVPVTDQTFYVDGEVLPAPELLERTCAWTAGEGRPSSLWPITAEQHAAVLAVQSEWSARFGAIAPDRVRYTDWGFVALPLVRELSDEELAAVWASERLETPKQRERAPISLGPERDGGLVYLHFLGSDALHSDIWARPSTIRHLLALADGWYTHCTRALAADPAMGASPATCTLQIGDLAWYNATLPDPLGHADHHAGTCVDLRLFRSDGSRYEAWWNRADDRPGYGHAYSRPLTQAFLAYALGHAPIQTVYFNDPVVRAALPRVEARSGHDDHIHLCFEP